MRPLPFTLRQLQYAIAVANTGGFRRAAEECHVAQPSLSAQVLELERALGVPLFERSSRSVRATSAGQRLLERARALLVDADDLAQTSRNLSDPLAGELRVGVIPTIAPYALGTFGRELSNALPKLRVLWTEDKTASLVSSLDRGELDAAVVALEAELGSLATAPIGVDRFVLAGPKTHPLFARRAKRIPFSAIHDQPIHLLDEGHCFRAQANDVCAKACAREASFRATSIPTLVRVTLGSGGLTLLPELALAIENRDDALAIRRFERPEPFRTLGLVYRSSSPFEAALQKVARLLRRALAAVSSGESA